MDGTLALWFDPLGDAAADAPRIDVHVNLWRDLPSGFDFLDVGLRHALRRMAEFSGDDLGKVGVDDVDAAYERVVDGDVKFRFVIDTATFED